MLGSSTARALWCWCWCCSLNLYHIVPLSNLPSTGLRMSPGCTWQASNGHAQYPACSQSPCVHASWARSLPPPTGMCGVLSHGAWRFCRPVCFCFCGRPVFPGRVLLPLLYPCTSTQGPWGLSSVAPLGTVLPVSVAGEQQQGSTRCTAISGSGQSFRSCCGPCAMHAVLPRLRCHRACFPKEAAQQRRLLQEQPSTCGLVDRGQ